MEHEFWQERWRENRIAFHEGDTNSLLVQHLHRLRLQTGDRIFVPLCGKAIDLTWLQEQGLHVVGVELNQGAVEEVFARMGIEPEISRSGGLFRYRSQDMELFVGDFFELTGQMLGKVDGIYDRAALIALPPDMRKSYSARLAALTNKAPQLLIALEYDQTQMNGPPFSVDGAEIEEHYAALYRMELLASRDIGGPLRERSGPGTENAWLLTPR